MCLYLNCLVLIGYPPKGLSLHNTGVSLSELGIRSGETLIVEDQPSQSGHHTEISNCSQEKDNLIFPKITRRFVCTRVIFTAHLPCKCYNFLYNLNDVLIDCLSTELFHPTIRVCLEASGELCN